MGDLLENIAAASSAQAHKFLGSFETEIELKVAQCADYSALLKGVHGEPATLGDLLTWAKRRGRVMVSGRGASGKSALLHRVTLRAAELNVAPFLISLSSWNSTVTDEWLQVHENAREALDLLLRRFGASDHDLTDAEFLPASSQKLFLLDGLNETPGSVADQILAACDQVASFMVGAAFIVTDRLVRRNLIEDRWCYAMPLPVENAEIARLLKGKEVSAENFDLLGSPFFLDRALQGELRESPLRTIADLIVNRGKLDDQGLIAAARVAFNAYLIDRSRTFSPARFLEQRRPDIMVKFLEGGILVKSGRQLAFFHHWYHDYLASKHVADQPDLLDPKHRHSTLEALTFKANSFDAISFTLELLPSERIGGFLQAVFDWNPYAAGYALAEARIATADVPLGDRLVILAMLAERRFDRLYRSAQRAADALDLLSDPEAQKMKEPTSLTELVDTVAAIDPPSKDFEEWQRVFTAKEADTKLVDAIQHENSTIGWTVANVLKRIPLREDQLEAVRRYAVHERAVVRWRAVHSMGVSSIFVPELLERLEEDPNDDVQYGAIRSLIEIASREPAELPRIVDDLIKRLDTVHRSSKVLGELARAVFLARGFAPPDWSEQISRLLYALLEMSQEPAEAEGWSDLASRVRIHHREPKAAA